MELGNEVKNSIGPKNVALLLDQIRNGLIKEQQIKDISLKMGVHGTFVQKRCECNELVYVMRYILDAWYRHALYKDEGSGYFRLVRILNDNDIGLGFLAQKMKRCPNDVCHRTNCHGPNNGCHRNNGPSHCHSQMNRCPKQCHGHHHHHPH